MLDGKGGTRRRRRIVDGSGVGREKVAVVTAAGSGMGAVVYISAFSAFGPSPAFPLSSAPRAALAGFTKLYLDRYAAEGVRMNNVLPGFIESFEIDEETRRSIPMQRQGSLSEITKTAAFLISDGSGYMTGQNIHADGGTTRSL